MQEISPYILNDITQMLTALGVILTAVSSIMNRIKLSRVDRKFDEAVKVAVATKQEAVQTGQAALSRMDQQHAVQLEKIEEVKQDLQSAKAEAMQAIKINGNGNNGH